MWKWFGIKAQAWHRIPHLGRFAPTFSRKKILSESSRKIFLFSIPRA